MLVQHTTVQDIYQHSYSTFQWSKKVLFSFDTNQVTTVDNNGTLAFEDVRLDMGSNQDYNDIVLAIRGAKNWD